MDAMAVRYLPKSLASFLFMISTVSAQQSVIATKNFKSLPSGLIRQTTQGYVDEKATGQTVVDTHCSAPISTETVHASMAAQAHAGLKCSNKMTTDTSEKAEWIQICDQGAMQSEIRSSLTRVNDRTIVSETRVSRGGVQGIHTRSTVEYLGACPVGMAPPAAPQLLAAPKLTAADCAQVVEMREQAKSATVESCSQGDLPPAYVARCEASMKSMQERMRQLESSCKP